MSYDNDFKFSDIKETPVEYSEEEKQVLILEELNSYLKEENADEFLLQESEESINKIKEDLLILKEIVDSVNSMIDEQKEDIEQIVHTVSKVEQNIESGNEELENALGYSAKSKKTVALTVGGAVVGSVLTGGVGSVFGVIPAVAGLGIGGSVGLLVGAVVNWLGY